MTMKQVMKIELLLIVVCTNMVLNYILVAAFQNLKKYMNNSLYNNVYILDTIYKLLRYLKHLVIQKSKVTQNK